MNKTEKLICLVLGAILAFYIWSEMGKAKERAEAAAKEAAIAATNVVAQADGVAADAAAKDAAVAAVSSKPPYQTAKKELPKEPEQIVKLENDELVLELSTWGATVKKATLKQYARDCGEIGAENPAVELSFASAPMGEGATIESFVVKARSNDFVLFGCGDKTRKITLGKDYRIAFEDVGIAGDVSIGAMRMGNSKNDSLSVDSWAMDAGKGKEGVIHHSDGDSPLKPYLVGGLVGGCSGAKSAAGMPAVERIAFPGAQKWIAAKNRFFVTALCSADCTIGGFETKVARDVSARDYRPDELSIVAKCAEGTAKRNLTFYVGPKKQSLLWELGMKDVMEFGMWRWLCYPLVWVLNMFNGWIPNFGIAIILLTILVRVLFWPLTHKSTIGMRKMQEIQPKMKAIQAKFKDNPQRLQQETWALYKAEKVNPMSSCLPMLIQIPVFIALFNVLRSAVELRYAPFLWIADLSEPEGLLAAYLPFGGLNILPILMAVSTGLQSAFTPSTGDKSQQKMMMIFMPLMMLVMFYSFPSALSLYWFLSNLFSIVQMWWIRRDTAKKTTTASGAIIPEVIDPPVTRQMRRHG